MIEAVPERMQIKQSVFTELDEATPGHAILASNTSSLSITEMGEATSRGEVSAPLVFLTYYNPILAFGLKAFCHTAIEAGVDGLIVADLPPEEAGPLGAEADPVGLDLIHLVAPTSTTERMRRIAKATGSFIYMVSLTGVTGARAELPPDLGRHLRALRGITTKPVCVGFGIGTPEHVALAGRFADGVIVGSAIVNLVERHAGSPDLLLQLLMVAFKIKNDLCADYFCYAPDVVLFIG